MAKKLTNDEKIVAALDSIDQSVRNLQKFSNQYNEHIDGAALRGDDKRARQLIKQKVGVIALMDQLKALKANLQLGAYTAQVAADLGKLPAAIAGCKGLLAESPNFKKVGADIQKIFKDMQKPVDEIAKLNEILDGVLSPQQNEKYSLINKLNGDDEMEDNDQFKAEYGAMMDRIKAKVATETVTKPAETIVGATGDIDFESIIKIENDKK